MTEESVKVAVRVRPFNAREIERKAKLVIQMQGQTTVITNPENPSDQKKFAFDFSYWSHDGYKEGSGGLLEPESSSSHYASQKKVFSDLGQGVLNNAFQGYNCSLFAYGQTGSGKSYSMVGYAANRGIVPITCDELFKAITSSKDADKRFEVTFSMLEIYNEQVRDLLSKDTPRGGLAVRQNPSYGFYVEGLKKVPVGSYQEIEQRMNQGTSNRTVAATNMNATSSRAHTVVTIIFDQYIKTSIGENKKSSIMNLVDLAGSERADSTGATGDRLKEGANINRSLSALGNVIAALADISMGKKKVVVPYRDSVLTKLLNNALGGNSKTIMIAALSPADINFDETLGTLRYADRAKQIKNTVIVNENPMDKLLKELRNENDRLKQALQAGAPGPQMSTQGLSPEEVEKLRREWEEEIRSQLNSNAQQMESHSLVEWEKKLQEAREEASREATASERAQAEKRAKVPYLSNLNEDPQLSNVLIHFLDKPEILVGREPLTAAKKAGAQMPNVTLKGLSISNEHAILTKNKGSEEWSIKPGSSDAKTKVNGLQLTGPLKLRHRDRILFGSNHLYIFNNPLSKEKDSSLPEKIDWDFAQAEIAKANGFQTDAANLSREQQIIRDQILEVLPMVTEVNAISEELNKQRSFEVVLISGMALEGLYGSQDTSTRLMVKMKHLVNGNTWIWERGKFFSRRFLMQELYQKHLDGEDLTKIKKEADPFWEPVEDVIIGMGHVFLRALSFCLDIDDRFKVIDYKGLEEGNVAISIIPCNQNGRALGDDVDVEDPKELLNKPYYFKILIRRLTIYKGRYNRGIRIRYRVFKDENWIETPLIRGTLEPEFQHSHTVTFAKVTQQHLDFFENGCITLVVLGQQEDSEGDSKFAQMTTKELRDMERATQPQEPPKIMASKTSPEEDFSKVKSELITCRRKVERLEVKEKRLQKLCTEWSQRPAEERDYEEFYKAVTALVHSTGSKFRTNLSIATGLIQASHNAAMKRGAGKNQGSQRSKQPVDGSLQSSKACVLM